MSVLFYKRKSFSLVTAPAEDPVTLAEAKAFAKIDGSDEDALITSFISAATRLAEEYTSSSFVTQTRRLTMDTVDQRYFLLPDSMATPTDRIDLAYLPLQSVTSIIAYDDENNSSTVSSDSYFVDTSGGRVSLNEGYTWPGDLRAVSSFQITYVAGYGDADAVPEPIKLAIKMHVKEMIDNRSACSCSSGIKAILSPYRDYANLGAF